MAPGIAWHIDHPVRVNSPADKAGTMITAGDGVGVWTESQMAVTMVAIFGGVGVAVVVVIAGVWAARRWVDRKNNEERQQILLWPGAGVQPHSFQTREIQFTLPPSLAPLGGPGGVDDDAGGSEGGGDIPPLHASVASLAGASGGSSGSSSTQDFASPSSSSLASLGSLDTTGTQANATDNRRSSITDLRRRSLQVYMKYKRSSSCMAIHTLDGSTANQGYSLGTLNPELYRIPDHLDDPGTYPPGHLGRVFLTLHYHSNTEKLQVGLLRIKNLPSRTFGSTNACDPYVRLSVLPDERRYLQTKMKKKTCNPVFDEHFGFHIPLRCVEERTLRVSVFDGGRHKRQPAIGHVAFTLAQVLADSAAAVASPTPNTNNVLVRDLTREEECATSSELGEVLVSLTYNDHLHRLTITVFQAKGIKVNEGETVSYMKVSLMNQRRAVKTKKTAVVAAGEEPQYNESFHFRPPPEMDGVHLSLQLHLAANSNAKGRVLGRVVIGSFMFARGRALNHWNEVLSTPKEAIQYWHPLTE
ncbi:synaptotagmin-15-like isoform X2 [Macrobrachium nipponense]|uniref:synaptotagmin-15-like isoform X2 n=1 Tax=Macrobrachium nipponense TaxID=159736 RepID=UPI0030C88729